MADRAQLDFTYSLTDRIFRLSLGELADFSGAKYDGDFSLGLEEAQRRKHEYVAEQIGIGPGRRVLDLGCGWGPLLDFVPRRGGTGGRRHAVGRAGGGVPPARARRAPVRRPRAHARELRAVRRRREPRRLRALLLARGVPRRAPGRDLPRRSSRASPSVLPAGGRLYLQTMVFGRRMIPRRGGGHRRAARLRRLLPRADGAPVPRLVAPERARPGGRRRRARAAPGVERERAARLHRDDPAVAPALRRARAPARRC